MVPPARWDCTLKKDLLSVFSPHLAPFKSLDLSSCGTGPLKLPQSCCWWSAGSTLTLALQLTGVGRAPFLLPATLILVSLSQTQNCRRDFPLDMKSAFHFYCLPQKSIFLTLAEWNVYSPAISLIINEGGIEKYNGHISLEKLQILLIFLCLPAFCIIFSCTSWINVPSNKEKSNGGNVIMTKFCSDPSKINVLFSP